MILTFFLGAIEDLELSLSEMWNGLEKSSIMEDNEVWKGKKMEKLRSFLVMDCKKDKFK